MRDQPGSSNGAGRGGATGWDAMVIGGLSAAEQRLVELVEEFRRRQRRRPDLVVRPWWTPGEAPGEAPAAARRFGFVVEYCPTGRDSVTMVVRSGRVTVDGPTGAREAALDLEADWSLDGVETGSPETLANHLLRLADRALEDAA